MGCLPAGTSSSLPVMATTVPDEFNSHVVLDARFQPLVTRLWCWLVVVLGLAMHVRTATAQTSCVAGQGLVNGVCTYCSPGSYSSIAGQSTCRQCPAGYVSQQISTFSTLCRVFTMFLCVTCYVVRYDMGSIVCLEWLIRCRCTMLHIAQVLLPAGWPINARYVLCGVNVPFLVYLCSLAGGNKHFGVLAQQLWYRCVIFEIRS
jgi:hypothetical protein